MGARKLAISLLSLSLLLAGCAGYSRSGVYFLNCPVYPARLEQSEAERLQKEEIERRKSEIEEERIYGLEDRVIPVRILSVRY